MKLVCKRFFAVFVMVIAAASFFSCANLLSGANKQGEATVSIRVSGISGRTIFSEPLEFYEFTYRLEWKDSDGNLKKEFEISSNEMYLMYLGKKILVEEGEWIFTLTAKRGGVDCYAGTISAEIKEGDNTLSFDLTELPFELDSYNNIAVTVKVSPDVDVDYIIAGLFTTNWEETEFSGGKIGKMDGTNSEFTYWAYNVPAGNYILSFRFYRANGEELSPGYSELIQIKPREQAKSITAEIEISEFEQFHKVTFKNISEEDGFGDVEITGEIPLVFSECKPTPLPDAEQFSRRLYTFGGWYESPDFSGDAVISIPAETIGDKTYWAKWVPLPTISYTLGDEIDAAKFDGIDGNPARNVVLSVPEGDVNVKETLIK